MKGTKMDLWAVRLTIPAKAADFVSEALMEDCFAVTTTEVEGQPGQWQLEAHIEGEPDRTAWQARLGHLAAAVGVPFGELETAPVEIRDWISELQKSFPPFEVGNFFIYGSHYQGQRPAGHYPLLVDAGMAFGSGEHATTAGCLRYLDRLRSDIQPQRMADIGCGSGILAMAMARQWWRPGMPKIIASDIDRASVLVTADNLRVNGLSEAVEAVESDGYRHALIRAAAPFDVIACNILAGPLMAFAPDAAKHLAVGGYLVLAGLIDRQMQEVVECHTAEGLTLVESQAVGEWRVLLLRKPPVAAG